MDGLKEICVLPVTIGCFFLIFLTLNCITFMPYSIGLRDKIATVEFTDFQLKKMWPLTCTPFLAMRAHWELPSRLWILTDVQSRS